MTTTDSAADRHAWLERVSLDGKEVWMLTCPVCGLRGDLDDDMFHGRVSTQCPDCSFHETVTWADHVRAANYRDGAIEIPWPPEEKHD